jgi:serine/threonine protein kinase
MERPHEPAYGCWSQPKFLRIDRLCERFEAELKAGKPPSVEDYLGDVPEEDREDLQRELLSIERSYASQGKRNLDPDHGKSNDKATFPNGGSDKASAEICDADQPATIGRYRVDKLLGKGGFGLVYLAYDEQLSRAVAVKVPHLRLIARPADAEPYLAEARTVAKLEHANIVPVYDVGSTEEFPCYVVSKYIDGIDLAAKIKQVRPSYAEAAELVATVAEALHHAHKQGIVHRDIKPSNIVLDGGDKPFVVDFGLALREEDVGKRASAGGTPAYMSPEQALGEGHRVDGRSDIFSLGVVLYELLTGCRPFRAKDVAELLDLIIRWEPRPPRQINETIPKELERICLRALSKRVTERYSTAKDLAEDLRHFIAEPSDDASQAPSWMQRLLAAAEANLASDTPPAKPTPDTQPIKIIFKGLRSFGAEDADFFLELLPGPRDREGLPDSIRFWKTRIEETDPDRTFPVGLIYGPSGCGKSSLVKAGLMPRLSDHVIPVYIESTAGETESRLLRGLRRRCPELPDNLGLKDTLAALRHGEGIPTGKKVLIVLDQFEQWLHAKKGAENAELVHALRQCDGGRVQCIVMVRDDFWMGATRFMRSLEIRLVEGENSNAVDLFPLRHAEKILTAFGRAFGDLPEAPDEATKDQENFLAKAVQDLAEDGKVICVRLALFAEMLKGKSWTPATLEEVGGIAGVGVTFLEETFSASTAPPEHRHHQKAARAVLKALLPESGTHIRGLMRSRDELLEASGYAGRSNDFEDLIHVLDRELKLLTPTDPEGTEAAEDPTSGTEAGNKYYQLTHDYLVPSLRDWLTKKQKETRRGRAELCLEELAASWNAKPENRQLPTLREYLNIRMFTERRRWSEPQRKMMDKAGRYHAVRGLSIAMLLIVEALRGLSLAALFIVDHLRGLSLAVLVVVVALTIMLSNREQPGQLASQAPAPLVVHNQPAPDLRPMPDESKGGIYAGQVEAPAAKQKQAILLVKCFLRAEAPRGVLDSLLARQRIIRDEADALINSAVDRFGLRAKQTPPTGLVAVGDPSYVYAEADARQVEGLLAAIASRTGDFPALVVEPGEKGQEAWRAYGHGLGPSAQPPVTTPSGDAHATLPILFVVQPVKPLGK